MCPSVWINFYLQMRKVATGNKPMACLKYWDQLLHQEAGNIAGFLV